ncbi:hypothetical protein RclHR1_03320010 [Rhizophagus clarus]|uniref:F-box domain-containing protein n=1 Tax=Rhizophagus clarus TaxID=94130 RepID=A0A2Z6RKU5_9GLOM|nr:hypothetical protein RclHR1_03320010 [Rhizophagus clarus]GET00421.1 hypothetical protein GLOIN_2v1784405 [Rhizophagus clarus]
MSQLSADCLNEIFEYLEDDKVSLYSCLLVNRLWCEVSVRILWINAGYISKHRRSYDVLISCLPCESKEILSNNGINISISTSKPPMFNYARFCRIISTYMVYFQVENFLKNHSSNDLINENNIYILAQEIFKLYIKQIPSIKELAVSRFRNLPMVPFLSYPEAKESLKNLSKLTCNSNADPELLYHLSQTCHNIHSLMVFFTTNKSNEIADLISAQKNLKYLIIRKTSHCSNIKVLANTKLPNAHTITKLIYRDFNRYNTSLSFITKFVNLQELTLCSFMYQNTFEDFKSLQYVKFPQLQILTINFKTQSCEPLINFLEINGSHLREFYLFGNNGDNSLNLAIAEYCSGLRKLCTSFKKDELETLRIVFDGCQNLKSIAIYCGDKYLSEKEALESIAKYSHKTLCEIILHYKSNYFETTLLPEELESFFISWKNRSSHNPLYFMVTSGESLTSNHKNMKIIEKYVKLGVVKKFKVGSDH